MTDNSKTHAGYRRVIAEYAVDTINRHVNEMPVETGNVRRDLMRSFARSTLPVFDPRRSDPSFDVDAFMQSEEYRAALASLTTQPNVII